MRKAGQTLILGRMGARTGDTSHESQGSDSSIGGGGEWGRELTLIGHVLCARCCAKPFHIFSHLLLTVSI